MSEVPEEKPKKSNNGMAILGTVLVVITMIGTMFALLSRNVDPLAQRVEFIDQEIKEIKKVRESRLIILNEAEKFAVAERATIRVVEEKVEAMCEEIKRIRDCQDKLVETTQGQVRNSEKIKALEREVFGLHRAISVLKNGKDTGGE